MVSFSWLKEKCKNSSWKLSEAMSAYNELSTEYNDFQAAFDLMKSENARFSKKLKETEATISMRET